MPGEHILPSLLLSPAPLLSCPILSDAVLRICAAPGELDRWAAAGAGVGGGGHLSGAAQRSPILRSADGRGSATETVVATATETSACSAWRRVSGQLEAAGRRGGGEQHLMPLRNASCGLRGADGWRSTIYCMVLL